MQNITTDGYTNEQREKLIADFLEKKHLTSRDVKDMDRAIAYAARLRETGQLNEAELYCLFLSRDEVMVPSDFLDHLWTLDLDEMTDFSKQAREEMQKTIEGAPTLTKKQKAVKIGILSNKISDAAIKGEPQEVLERLIHESMVLIKTPTVD